MKGVRDVPGFPGPVDQESLPLQASKLRSYTGLYKLFPQYNRAKPG